MYVYQSQSGHFEVAAYTSTRCTRTRMAACWAPSFNTRAEAQQWVDLTRRAIEESPDA